MKTSDINKSMEYVFGRAIAKVKKLDDDEIDFSELNIILQMGKLLKGEQPKNKDTEKKQPFDIDINKLPVVEV